MLNKFWRDHISDKCGFGEATFYCAMAVKDKRMERRKLGGIVPRRVHVDVHQGCSVRRTQKRPTLGLPTCTRNLSVSWVTEDFLWDHEWITETRVTMKENLILEARHYDIEVPCLLQWALLWFSAPTNLNRKFLNNGARVAKPRDTVSSAIELSCNIASKGLTPRGSVSCGR